NPHPRHEIKWLWKETYGHVFPDQVHGYTQEAVRSRNVMVLCNHCENPPCVRVCPTQATWKREDGIVMMDMHRCIGCRYCIVACPYAARSFNWKDPRTAQNLKNPLESFPTRMKGVVEKCNFCADRLADGKIPACVESCQKSGAGALAFGKLEFDSQGRPSSQIARMIGAANVIRRKSNLGTEPHIFYIV
ncbi:MAG: 4Fe-4S dicluster domain-containing protein, partial [Pseudomonadota bacterium]